MFSKLYESSIVLGYVTYLIMPCYCDVSCQYITLSEIDRTTAIICHNISFFQQETISVLWIVNCRLIGQFST